MVLNRNEHFHQRIVKKDQCGKHSYDHTHFLANTARLHVIVCRMCALLAFHGADVVFAHDFMIECACTV